MEDDDKASNLEESSADHDNVQLEECNRRQISAPSPLKSGRRRTQRTRRRTRESTATASMAAADGSMAELAATEKVTYPAEGFGDGWSLLKDVQARCAAAGSSVYKDLADVLKGFANGDNTDELSVSATAVAILADHPDFVARFNDLVDPRRHQVTVDPSDDVDEDARRRCVDRNNRAAAVVDDSGHDKVSRFLEQVKSAGGSLLYDETVTQLLRVDMEVKMDAHEVYSLAQKLFGSATNSHLLSEFAAFLPTERDVPPEERRPVRKRKATAAAAGKTNRPAKRPCKDTTNVSPFRQFWEFETSYSKLVSTTERTEDLLRAYKNEEDPDAAAGDSPDLLLHHGRRRLTFEDIFPAYETREVLQGLYGDHWGKMLEALMDDNRRRKALELIMARLAQQEDIAVKVAMERRRRDPAPRAKSKLEDLVMETVAAPRARAGIDDPFLHGGRSLTKMVPRRRCS